MIPGMCSHSTMPKINVTIFRNFMLFNRSEAFLYTQVKHKIRISDILSEKISPFSFQTNIFLEK